MSEILYQQLEWGSGLKVLYVQAPATGETGIQGQLWGRLSVHILVCSHPWTSTLLSQRGEQDEAIDGVCVRISTLSVCLLSVCAITHMVRCMCMYLVYMCALCACAYWEHISLAAGWTWAHGAAATLHILGS